MEGNTLNLTNLWNFFFSEEKIPVFDIHVNQKDILNNYKEYVETDQSQSQQHNIKDITTSAIQQKQTEQQIQNCAASHNQQKRKETKSAQQQTFSSSLRFRSEIFQSDVSFKHTIPGKRNS